MQFWLFLTLTAIAVSIDSMTTGFAVGLKNKFSLLFPAVVAVVTFILCTLAVLLGIAVTNSLSTTVQVLGSGILIGVGILNIAKKQPSGLHQEELPQRECLLLSVGVGLDAAIANLSLAIMGHTSIWVCLLFAAMHLLFVSLGSSVAKTKFAQNLKHANKVAGVCLILLGIIKLI